MKRIGFTEAKLGGQSMQRRTFLRAAGVAAMALALSGTAWAQETVKVGLILPMTGPFASTGRQIDAAVKLYGRRQKDPADREG
jgi:branched-chain amino acid transport system substrate-binding protein